MNIRIYLCQKNYTNICIGKYLNIFEYPNICHTLTQTHTSINISTYITPPYHPHTPPHQHQRISQHVHNIPLFSKGMLR